MLTTADLQILMPLIDLGVKAAGLQVFQNNGGVALQAVLAKLQKMADEDGAEGADGEKTGTDAP